jgi:hypothetical protein
MLAGELNRYIGTTYDTQATCSLIVRHAKTLRRYDEMLCGDGIHSGEWVNANHERIQATCDRLEARIIDLVANLPESDGGRITAVLHGDPRGFIVSLEVPTSNSCSMTGQTITRTVGVW